ncbi:MAG: sirohydrochlorin nickelochelatase [Methanophagales archaeon ANME-1-THS]|nr:MAG: sirohydrochlorin nickelochelatase [Methanophagales archaeon ANME-1-THS]
MMNVAQKGKRDVGGNGDDIAVILIGHGSTLPYNREVLEELRKRLEKREIFKAVRVAFMQLNSPSIEEVLRTLAQDGMKTIVAQPVFLADGAHTKEDIPEKLKLAFEGDWEDLGNEIKLIYAKPIGVDERIVDILLDRVKEAIEGG